MNNKKISVIINKKNSFESVGSILGQTFTNYEYFITENSVDDITNAIQKTSGDYILFMDSDSILKSTALEHISKMIYLTGADIIKIGQSITLTDTDFFDFKYIFQRENIMQYAFCDLSAFCIKKEIVKSLNFELPKHVLILDMLMHAKDITATEEIYMITRPSYFISDISEYKQITDYVIQNYEKNTVKVWKNYFNILIPHIIKDTTKQNRKDVFSYCCKNIPLKLIPLKYRFIFFIMKVCI
jgi:hypothetical protein